jgi:hypothetical protein
MADKQAKDLEAYKKQRRRERARSNYDKKLRRDLQRY